MNYLISIRRLAYQPTFAKTNLLHLVRMLIIVLGVLGIATLVQAGAVTSGQQTSVPNASTDPNQPSILETDGIPNSGLPTQGNKLACNNPEGNPNGCGESNIASQGNQSQTNAGAGNPINVMTGNKYQREDDMPALPGIMGIEIVRHYNSLHMGLGQIGYGWRLSYETDLQMVRNQIYIHQADGSRVIFNRSSINPSDCACQNPAQGHVMIYHTPKGDEYTWYWLDGKQLHFNHQGKLTRINAPTGESVKLTRGLRGELLKVTDPQGRSLVMHYASQHQPGFKGIVAIDTPVGRYTYHHDNDPKSPGISNLIGVEYPHSASDKTSLQRHYLYGEQAYVSAKMVSAQRQPAIPHTSHLLTGIQLTWQAGKAKQQQRLRTWAYDAYGRGVLSVHGLPKQLDANGKPKTGTGIEQVTLNYAVSPIQTKQINHTAKPNPRISHNGQLGQTILTNSLGQTTTYIYTLIAGEPRLLQVVGAGCAECGETNRVYGYDKLGRLSHNTQVKVITNESKARNKTKLQGLQTIHTEYDPIGRPIRISSIGYINGKAQTPTLTVRYAYANTPSFPQLKSAPRAVEQPVYVANKPSLIATPSVVVGKEHQWHIRYNQHGQPIQITETGYRPALIKTASAEATQISRTITYRYQTINGRSVLAQMDGPLPNGKTNTPKDSDITQYQYDKLGQYLTKITAPNNLETMLAYDNLSGLQEAKLGGTGRLIKKIESNLIAKEFTYNKFGKITHTQRYPASLNITSAKEEGLLQSTEMAYDLLGNTTMIKRADGQAVFMQYSNDGKLIQLRDALGNRVEWKDWAKANHQENVTVTTQQWFTADAPDTVARAWYFWRDDQNRLTQRLNPDGGLDTWQYSQGDVTSTSQNQWVQHNDPLNRMTLNAVSSQGSAQVRMTPEGYIDANFSATAYQEEAQAANQSSNTQTAQSPVQIQDDFGRAIQFSSAQHGTHIADYNAANRIAKIQQPDGTQIDYTYDVAGRLLTKTATHPQPKQTASVHYTYNLFGLSQIKDSHQTLSYSQDLLGREIDKATTLNLKTGLTKTYHIHTRYTVDGKIKAKQLINGDWLVFGLDNKTGLTQAMTIHKTIWPSLTNKMASWLNMPDLPLQIATTKTVVTDINVHPFNGITHLTHGNGISDDYVFDLAGRLTGVSHGKQSQNNHANSPLIKASYTYDAGRRLISEQISTADLQGKVKAYAYTGWNDFASPPKEGFIKTVKSIRQNNNMDAVTSNATLTYADTAQTSLDQAGRTTRDEHHRYQYDVWGKLTRVQNKTNNTIIASYQSNAFGERVMASYPTATNNQQANTNQTRYYLYDKQQRIAELDENGDVIQQYLYVNQSPVTVINTPTTPTEVNQEGIIAIHTDRRHAPVMATDEQGNIIWQAEYEAWGKVIPASLQEEPGNPNQNNQANNLNLALRLPGQWQDQATGLYYNYQRDYNPDAGRYLTPDPLGFPDGPDPYAYVNNDPLNKLDPLGLYQSDIHYYMTFFLAVAAGVPAEDARIIALAAQYVDENPATRPVNPTNTATTVWSMTWNQQMLIKYHFTLSDPKTGNTIKDYDNSLLNTVIDNPSDQLNSLLAASVKAECKNAQLQFFGEYLHAFEDTFSHRDKTNKPYDALGWFNLGVGHGLDASEPDYTFDNETNGWDVRAQRTLAMELEVFNKFNLSPFKTGREIDINILKAALEEFNSIQENEETEKNKKQPFEQKFTLLNQTLADWGIKNADGSAINLLDTINNQGKNSFNEEEAASNRNRFLCDAQGNRLMEAYYPGIIPPTNACPK